jgi:hypothetical protein
MLPMLVTMYVRLAHRQEREVATAISGQWER